MNIIEKLKKEKLKWENRIYGVGETRIDLMIEDVIRELQKYQAELEKKDRIIKEMAEQLVGLSIYDEKEVMVIFLKDEEVKEYYTNKVEREGK